jgi:hypothetical protein
MSFVSIRVHSWFVFAATAMLLQGCDEDPVAVERRVWCVEQGTRSLYALPLDRAACESRGYLDGTLGPIAMDPDERLLAVDLLQRELLELQPSDGFATPLFSVSQAVNPLALTVAPGGRLYLLDDERRVVWLEREGGAWTRAWPIHPDGQWRGLAWLPEAVEEPGGRLLPVGTLLAWRPLGQGGELAWLELLESEALAHTLLSTPALTGLDTSARLRAIYGLDAASGELYRLRPELGSCPLVQTYACDAFAVTDICLP